MLVSNSSVSLLVLLCLCMGNSVLGLTVMATLELPSNSAGDLSQRGCVDSMQGKGYVVVSSDSSPFLYRFTLDPLSFKAEDKTFLVPEVVQSHGVLCDSFRGILYIYGRSAAVPGVGSFATIESVDIRNGTVLGMLASYSTIATNEDGFLSAFVEPKKGHVFANCLEQHNSVAELYELDLSQKDEAELVHESGMTAVDGGGSTFEFAAVLCEDGTVGICTEDSSVAIIMATAGEEHARGLGGDFDSSALERYTPEQLQDKHGFDIHVPAPLSGIGTEDPAATMTPTPTPTTKASPSPVLPTPSPTPTGGSPGFYPLVATFRNFYPWPLKDFQLFGYTTTTALQFTTCANNTRPVTVMQTCDTDCSIDTTGVVTLEVLNQDLSVAREVFLTAEQGLPSQTALACVGRSSSALVSVDNVVFWVDLESGTVQILPLIQYESVEWLSCDAAGVYAYAGVSSLNPTADSGFIVQISLLD